MFQLLPPGAPADDDEVTLYVCTVLVLCKTFYRQDL